MSEYPPIIYYKKERQFGTSTQPFIIPADKPKKFELTVFADSSQREKLFSGIVKVFADNQQTMHAEAKDTETNEIIARAQVDSELPNDIPLDKKAGFIYGADTNELYRERALSRVLRSLLLQTFAKKFELTGSKDKIVGKIKKGNDPSLKARFFSINPQTNQLYLTDVTGIIHDPRDGDFYIVTTFLNQPSDMKTQTKLYEKYKTPDQT